MTPMHVPFPSLNLADQTGNNRRDEMARTPPQQKGTARVTPKKVARATSKKAARKDTTRDMSSVKHSRIEKPEISKDGSYPIRRILAERITSDGELYFLLDWYPTWQKDKQKAVSDGRVKSQYGMKTSLRKYWEITKKNGRVYKPDDGDILISSSNLSNDDVESSIRLMIESVVEKVKEHMGIDQSSHTYNAEPRVMADRLFPKAKDEEWIFATYEDKREADNAPLRNGESEPSAGEVMRRTYIEMRRNHKKDTNRALRYRDVCVKFRGQVDKKVDPVARPIRGVQPRYYLVPLFSSQFLKLKPDSWKPLTMHDNVAPLSKAVRRLVQRSPYLLQELWVMFLVRLFYSSTELEQLLLESSKITTTNGWDDRSRDEFLYTYMKAFAKWEVRSVDRVKVTYMRCREWIAEHMENPESTDQASNRVEFGNSIENEDELIALENDNMEGEEPEEDEE
jgi:hypothetical protein